MLQKPTTLLFPLLIACLLLTLTLTSLSSWNSVPPPEITSSLLNIVHANQTTRNQTKLITESITFSQSYNIIDGQSISFDYTGSTVRLCPDLRFGKHISSKSTRSTDDVNCMVARQSTTAQNNTVTRNNRSFLSFTVNLPTNALTMTKATLQLYVYDWYSTNIPVNGAMFGVYAFTQTWSEASLDADRNWADMQHYSMVYSNYITITAQQRWVEWDVTEIVHAWETGSMPNYGFMMGAYPTPNTPKWAVAAYPRTVITQSLTPRLVLTYLRPSSPTATFIHNAPHEWQQTTYFTFTGSTGDDLPANVTYNWNFGDVNSQGGENLKYVTNMYNVPGQYTATLTIENLTDKHIFTDTVLITEIKPRGLTITHQSLAQLNMPVHFMTTITDGTNVNYTWNFGDGTITSSGLLPTTNYSYTQQTGMFPIIVTASNNGGTMIANSNIEILDLPTSCFTTDSPNQKGESTTFTNCSQSGGDTQPLSYQWNFGDGQTSADKKPTHLYTAVGTHTVILTVTNRLNIPVSSSQVVTITDVPITGLDFNVPAWIWFNKTLYLTATVETGSNVVFAWNLGDGSSIKYGSSISHNYANTGTHTITLTASNSISPSHTVVESTKVLTMSQANFISTSPDYFLQTTILTNTSNDGGDEDVTYAWDLGDDTFTNSKDISHTYDHVKSYTVTLTAVNDITQSTFTDTVIIKDFPIISLTFVNDSPTYLNSSTAFTREIISGTHVSYQWDFGDNSPTKTNSSATVQYTYSMTGIYTAILTATNSESPVVTATTIVTIVDVPIQDLTLVNDSPTLLKDMTTSLYNSTTFTRTILTGTNVRYDWNFDDGSPITTTIFPMLTYSLQHTYTNIGTYTVIVTATNSTNTVTATTIVTIEDVPPHAHFISSSPDLATRPPTTFWNLSKGTNLTFTWSFSNNAMHIFTTTRTVSHAYTTAGMYTATLTATNSAGFDVYSNVVQILASITNTIACFEHFSPYTIMHEAIFYNCSQDGADAPDNVHVWWNFGDGTPLDYSKNVTITHSYTKIGRYTVTVTISNSVNIDTYTDTIDVVDVPISGLTIQHDMPTIFSRTIHLTADITYGTNPTYTWDFDDGMQSVQTTGMTTTFPYTPIGRYTVTLTATNRATLTPTDSINTKVVTKTIDIVDEPINDILISDSSPTIIGHSTYITVDIISGTNVNTVVNLGDGTITTNMTITYPYTAVGEYMITVTATNQATLTSTDSINTKIVTKTIEIIDEEITGLVISNSSPTQFGSPTYFTSSTVSGTNIHYLWNFGDGITSTLPNPVYTYPAPYDCYHVTLIATNSNSSQIATDDACVWDDIPIKPPITITTMSPIPFGQISLFKVDIFTGTKVTYHWNFGDGEPVETTPEKIITYLYQNTGTYSVIVTATNRWSMVTDTVRTATVNVEVYMPLTGLDFLVSHNPQEIGRPIYFTAPHATGQIETYLWNFGDGTITSTTNLTTEYTYPTKIADYHMHLTVFGTYSQTVTKTKLISIYPEKIRGLTFTHTQAYSGQTTFFTSQKRTGSNISYMWNFGDGNTSIDPTSGHVYTMTGTYMVNLTASNKWTDSVIVTNTVTVNEACQPITGLELIADKPTEIGNVTHFTAAIESGNHVSYTWYFGDGEISPLTSSNTVTHTYPKLGDYVVKLFASNACSSDSRRIILSILPKKIISFTISSYSPKLRNCPVSFDYVITPAEGTHADFLWDFDDGTTTTMPRPTHAYSQTGIYSVTATAFNEWYPMTDTTIVSVYENPIIGLTFTVNSPISIYDNINFNVHIDSGSNVTLNWDFGNSYTESILNAGCNQNLEDMITHVYTQPDTYIITLTATNSLSSSVMTQTIIVQDEFIVIDPITYSQPLSVEIPVVFTTYIESGTNVNYYWDCGNGTTTSVSTLDRITETTMITTTCIYTQSQSYMVSFMAENSAGSVMTHTTISISDQPVEPCSIEPISGLTFTHTHNAPVMENNPIVVFTTSIITGEDVTYTWDFGDGKSLITESLTISHPYNFMGTLNNITYAVTLTASNICGIYPPITDVVMITREISPQKPIHTQYLPLVSKHIISPTCITFPIFFP